MVLLLLLLATGCWKLDDPTISTTVVPFDNDHVVTETALVTTVTPDPPLDCPNGEPATFFIVHDDEVTYQVPVAIVFHSGAFDYVVNASTDAPLDGTHYGDEDRLNAGWARERVFQLLGMWEGTPDPAEVHEGTLPAALADAGIAALYPGNCWGDLWHNYYGRQENDEDLDQFYRNGLAFGAWMFRVLVDPEFVASHGFTLPFEPDTSRIALLGLGDGGRAIGDLLPMLRTESWSSGYAVSGVMLDSTPDDLSYYVENIGSETAFYNGLVRIFTEEGDLADLGQYSTARFLQSGGANRWPSRLLLLSSAADPILPADTLTQLEAWIRNRGASEVYVSREMGGASHIFSNRDMQTSREVRDFLFP
jgi:hypothetical protein